MSYSLDSLAQLPENPFKSDQYNLRRPTSLLYHNSEDLSLYRYLNRKEIHKYSTTLPSYQLVQENILDKMEKQISLLQHKDKDKEYQGQNQYNQSRNAWDIKRKVIKNPFGGQDLIVSNNQNQIQGYIPKNEQTQKSLKRLDEFKKLKTKIHTNNNYQDKYQPISLLNHYKQNPIVKYKKKDVLISFGFEGFPISQQAKQQVRQFKNQFDYQESDQRQNAKRQQDQRRLKQLERLKSKMKSSGYPRTLSIKGQTYHMISIS